MLSIQSKQSAKTIPIIIP